MAKARANAEQTADQGELDHVAGELYARRPDDFAAARDEQVRTARADGRPALARELARLRRPTQSAWLINTLWRDQRDVMEQLFQLADELSRAQAEASGPDLHRLTAQRRELEAALIRRARALAEQAGVSVSASMEREAQETLAAALARPEVAAEVRTGRLVKPAAYAGFGSFVSPAAGNIGRERPAIEAAESEDAAAARPTQPDDFEAHKARRAHERDSETARRADEDRQAEAEKRQEAEKRAAAQRHAETQRRVDQARAAVEAAAGALADHERAANAVHQHDQDVRRRLAGLQQQLRDLEGHIAATEQEREQAEQQRERADQQRDQAEKAHAEARRALEHAEQLLKEPAPEMTENPR